VSYRGRIDDPGVMEGILAAIDAHTREYWLERLAQYENEKPGRVILPGVPPAHTANATPATRLAPKKPRRKVRQAA